MNMEGRQESVDKQVVGLIEKVKVIGENAVDTEAIMDTGATATSVDARVAKEAALGPIAGLVKVRSKTAAGGFTKRVKVIAKIELKGKVIPVEVNVTDRKRMYKPVLIGRDVLYSNFIVDVEKTHNSNRIDDTKE